MLAVVAVALAAAAAYYDRAHRRVPNALTLPALAFALAFAPSSAIAGALCCFIVPFFLAMNERAGGGDVKLLVALGALLGVGGGLVMEYLVLAFVVILPPRIRRPAAPAILPAVVLVSICEAAFR